MIRRLASRILEDAGHEVVEAGDGAEAVRCFEDRDGAFDCVILDLEMPRMDGAQALEEIRRSRPDVPVVILTGHGEDEVEGRFDGVPGLVVLCKPFRGAALVEAVQRLLRS
jgi:CheY-like chemotaxis protein